MSAPCKLLVTQNEARPVDIALVSRLMEGVASVDSLELPHRDFSPAEADRFVERAGGCDAILLRPGRLYADVIGRLDRLKAVALFATGLNQVDVGALSARGVKLINAPGGNARAVAEYTFGLMIALMRGILPADRMVREGGWAAAVTTGFELHGKTLGIVGLGNIGSKVARIAQGFGLTVLANDPFVGPARFAETGAAETHLDDLLRRSDVVTLHVPHDETTDKLIDARRVALLKSSAVLINTARGGIIDEGALIEALRARRIAGAAVDAFSEEPLPAASPFCGLANVIVTPHQAGQSYDCRPVITEMVCADLRRALTGQPPVNLANSTELAAATRRTPAEAFS